MIKTALDQITMPPVAKLLGWQLLDARPAEGWLKLGFEGKPEFLNPAGFIQGGILSAMLDDTMGPAVLVMTEGRSYTTTVSLTVNFLNPDKPLSHDGEAGIVSWNSVTTGNMAGFDLLLERERAGVFSIETNIVSAECDLAALDDNELVVEAGGLGRQIRVYRLPETRKVTSMQVTHDVTGTEAIEGDVPVYIRVTQEDANQAWSSPIYLIKN